MWVSVRELEDVIGKEPTAKLCKVKGGAQVYVPKVARVDHSLAAVIGWSGYRIFCHEYGGETLMIPNGNKAEPCKEKVLTMLDEGGKSRQEIATACGVTMRYVYLLAQLSPEQRKEALAPPAKAGSHQLFLPLG